MTKSCPVCGTELKPLFSSLQCFNERCGQDDDYNFHEGPKYRVVETWRLPAGARLDSEAAVNEWAERDSGFGGSVWVWTDNNGVEHKVVL